MVHLERRQVIERIRVIIERIGVIIERRLGLDNKYFCLQFFWKKVDKLSFQNTLPREKRWFLLHFQCDEKSYPILVPLQQSLNLNHGVFFRESCLGDGARCFSHNQLGAIKN